MKHALLKFFGFASVFGTCAWFGIVSLTPASAVSTTVAYVVVEWLFNKRSKRSGDTDHG